MYVNALKTTQRANVTYFRSSRHRDTLFWRSCDTPSCIRCSSMRVVVHSSRRPSVRTAPMNVRVDQYWLPSEGCGTPCAFELYTAGPTATEKSELVAAVFNSRSVVPQRVRAGSTRAVLDVLRCPIMGFALRLSEKCLAAFRVANRCYVIRLSKSISSEMR